MESPCAPWASQVAGQSRGIHFLTPAEEGTTPEPGSVNNAPGRQRGKRTASERIIRPETSEIRGSYRELPATWSLNLNAVGLDLVVEGLTTDAEALGSFKLVTTCVLEHLDDGIAFDALKQSEVCIL